MIGIDTNILIRYLVKDDPVQTPEAVRIVNGLSSAVPGWLSITVIAELAWTLRRIYKMDREGIAGIVQKLLNSNDMILEQHDTVQRAVLLFRNCKADLADCMLAVGAGIAGCERIVTFDRIAARDLGMKLIE